MPPFRWLPLPVVMRALSRCDQSQPEGSDLSYELTCRSNVGVLAAEGGTCGSFCFSRLQILMHSCVRADVHVDADAVEDVDEHVSVCLCVHANAYLIVLVT